MTKIEKLVTYLIAAAVAFCVALAIARVTNITQDLFPLDPGVFLWIVRFLAVIILYILNVIACLVTFFTILAGMESIAVAGTLPDDTK